MFQKIIRKLSYTRSCVLRKINIGKFKTLINKHKESDTSGLAKCIYKSIKRKEYSVEEQKALKQVKKLRKYYQNCNEVIEIKDFGAGNPDMKRTLKEMEQGVVETVRVSSMYKDCSTPEKWGELLFRLVREFKPHNCLELGTCLGISASYQLLAIQLNKKGKLTTIEGAQELGKLAQRKLKEFTLANFELLNGRFIDILPHILEKESQYDYVFIDGHHDEDATLKYFNMIYPKLAEKSIVIFDDINWSGGMVKFWKGMITDSRISISFDLYKLGVCYINKGSLDKSVNNIKLCI